MTIRRLVTPVLALATFVLLCAGYARSEATAPAAGPSTGPATAPAAVSNAAVRPAPPAGTPAAVITLAGQVDDYNRDSLVRNFAKARKAGAKVVILRVDTYGGLVSSGEDISRFIKNQTDLHTIAFIDSKAISAGAMIALACDEIVMVPSATLGDCAPIVFRFDGSLETLPPAERAKQEGPVVTDFKDSAKRNGYDPLLVTSMVAVDRTVYYVEDGDGHRRFVDEPTYKVLTAGGVWKPVPDLSNPVDGPTTLLTVTTDEAIKLGLARGQAPTAEALAAERGYPVVGDFSPGVGDKAIAFLGSPFIRGILITIFLTSLFIALKMPGHGAAEAFALLSLGVLVGVPLLTGYAQWWEIGIILLGLGLVAFEIFVFPGHLVSLVLGSLMVMGGLLFTFIGDLDMPGSWNTPTTWSHLQHGLYVIVGGLAGSMLLFSWLRRQLPRLPYFNRLVLPTTSAGTTGIAAAARPLTAADREVAGEQWPFVGTVGVALSELKPGGRAEFPYGGDTRSASVVCECGYVAPGTKLAVREVRGNRVVVRPFTNTA